VSRIYDPPEEVIVIAYVWRKGNASGGRREVFVSMADAERRLAALDAADEIKFRGDVKVLRLGESEWWPMEVNWPADLRLTPGAEVSP
jgi:hypothetical protein